MKKIILLFSLLTFMFACQKEISDTQAEYFIRFYGEALDDFGVGVEPVENGYAVAATTIRSNGNNQDIMFFTTDKFGYQNSDAVFYGGTDDEICTDMLVLQDGYVLSGSSTSADGTEKVVLIKLKKDGSLEWSANSDSLGRINDITLINNQIVTAGYLWNETGLYAGMTRPMIFIFDLQGNCLNNKGPANNGGDYLTSIGISENNIFGYGTQKNSSIYIFRPNGEPFESFFTGSQLSSKVISSKNGGFFILGTSVPSGSGYSQILVKKLKADFSEDLDFNTNPLGSDAKFRAADILEFEDGRVVILGDKTLKDSDIILYFLNSDGSLNSLKTYGKTGNQTAAALKITADGGLIILGSNQQSKTNSMITLIKTDKDGNIWE